MSGYVYADHDGVVTSSEGALVTVHRGEVWAADDPFVAERPDLFSTSPTVLRHTLTTSQPEPTRIERATRRPGAKRGGSNW